MIDTVLHPFLAVKNYEGFQILPYCVLTSKIAVVLRMLGKDTRPLGCRSKTIYYSRQKQLSEDRVATSIPASQLPAVQYRWPKMESGVGLHFRRVPPEPN